MKRTLDSALIGRLSSTAQYSTQDAYIIWYRPSTTALLHANTELWPGYVSRVHYRPVSAHQNSAAGAAIPKRNFTDWKENHILADTPLPNLKKYHVSMLLCGNGLSTTKHKPATPQTRIWHCRTITALFCPDHRRFCDPTTHSCDCK